MGKATGFMEYNRCVCSEAAPQKRIGDFEDFHSRLPETERRRQGGRCMDCGVPFCQAGIRFDGKRIGCPLHNLIPEWNDMLWQGNREQALARLLKINCFPEFTGRVCPAPCEAGCTCGMIGKPVTIRENELDIVEYAFENGMISPQPPELRSGKQIAVVGSGPAGLAAAYFLNRRGHSVTVYERDAAPGGLLTYGIPNMKLPKTVVSRRISLMEQEGIAFKTGVCIGRDMTMEELRQSADCIILCCGAQKPRSVPFEGNAAGVCYALDYLKSVARMQLGETESCMNASGLHVAVIGAGDSASDCVATAIRQGCASVTQIIRKPRDYYPADTDYAHAEAQAVFGGDIRRFQTQVKAVVANEKGELCQLVLSTPAGEETIEAQMLIVASGFSGTEDENASLAVETDTSSGGLIVAGDMCTGASLVVQALAEGRRAAAQADAFLMGYTNLEA